MGVVTICVLSPWGAWVRKSFQSKKVKKKFFWGLGAKK
jgi:hypothetical protein